jgi:methylated-DNA-protein-cysteine methyltransferase-like protein
MSNEATLNERVWQVVAMIPAGRVATYGQIGKLAGCGPRQVGRILSQLPRGSKLPWHRVINAGGRISFEEGTLAYRRQRRRLREDGVIFKGKRVSLREYGWEAGE